MARRGTTGGTPATMALTRAGVEPTGCTPTRTTRTRRRTAWRPPRHWDVDPRWVLKTLFAAVETSAGGPTRLVVGVVPVAGQLDLKAVACGRGGQTGCDGGPDGSRTGLGLRRRRHLAARPETWSHLTVVDVSALGPPHRVRLGRPARPGDRAGTGRPALDHRRSLRPHPADGLTALTVVEVRAKRASKPPQPGQG